MPRVVPFLALTINISSDYSSVRLMNRRCLRVAAPAPVARRCGRLGSSTRDYSEEVSTTWGEAICTALQGTGLPLAETLQLPELWANSSVQSGGRASPDFCCFSLKSAESLEQACPRPAPGARVPYPGRSVCSAEALSTVLAVSTCGQAVYVPLLASL